MKIKCNGAFYQASWWIENENSLPTLFKIFMAHSFVPASSSVVESEFSYTGLVITDRRNRILPENVNEW